MFEPRPEEPNTMPPEALAFLSATDCRAVRHV